MSPECWENQDQEFTNHHKDCCFGLFGMQSSLGFAVDFHYAHEELTVFEWAGVGVDI